MSDLSHGLLAQVLLNRLEFKNAHSLGQNFLLDDNLLIRLVEVAGVEKTDNVLEIGPGPGVMTAILAERAKKVVAVEIDRHLEPVLSEMLLPFENASVVFEDVLKCDLRALTEEAFSGEPFRVVANLPYYITADTILHVLLSGAKCEDICVMVQKEAAERMWSSPGEKSWGQFAATVRYFGEVEVLEEVPREAFNPPPHVENLFIRLRLHAEKPVVPQDEALFLKVIQAAFFMRRKTLFNNLKAFFSLPADKAQAAIENAGLPAQVRGEALSLEEIARLSDALGELIG